MKITITRSFRRVRQIAEYVPVEAYCEATAEWEPRENETQFIIERNERISSELDQFCQSEVEKTLVHYRPVCIACGGKGETVILNKESVCGNCVKQLNIQAAEFRANSKKNEPPATGKKVV